MTIIEQIKAEIERMQENILSKVHHYPIHRIELLDDLLSFLSDLEKSENPMNQEDLEEEIIKCWQEWVSPSNKQSVDGVLPLSEFAFYARHFAEWGAEHLKK